MESAPVRTARHNVEKIRQNVLAFLESDSYRSWNPSRSTLSSSAASSSSRSTTPSSSSNSDSSILSVDSETEAYPTVAVLLATGSFCPPSLAHIRALRIVKNILEKTEGMLVVGGLISPSHDSYVLSKYGRGWTLSSESRGEAFRVSIEEDKENEDVRSWLDVDLWESSSSRFRDFPEVRKHLEAYLSGAFGHLSQGVPINIRVFYVADEYLVRQLGHWDSDWIICLRNQDSDHHVPARARCIVLNFSGGIDWSGKELRNLVRTGASLELLRPYLGKAMMMYFASKNLYGFQETMKDSIQSLPDSLSGSKLPGKFEDTPMEDESHCETLTLGMVSSQSDSSSHNDVKNLSSDLQALSFTEEHWKNPLDSSILPVVQRRFTPVEVSVPSPPVSQLHDSNRRFLIRASFFGCVSSDALSSRLFAALCDESFVAPPTATEFGSHVDSWWPREYRSRRVRFPLPSATYSSDSVDLDVINLGDDLSVLESNPSVRVSCYPYQLFSLQYQSRIFFLSHHIFFP